MMIAFALGVLLSSTTLAQDQPGSQLPLCRAEEHLQADCVHPPTVKQGMRAEYPDDAATTPAGDVVLSVLVDKKGKPHEIAVVQSQSQEFDDSATAALQQWRFDPARTSKGEKVPLRITVRFTFPPPDAAVRDAFFVCSAKHPTPCAKVPPKPRYTPDPEYSPAARSAHIQGMVKLLLVVDAKGDVAYVKVEKGLGYDLDEASVNAVKKWHFEPARLEDGTPVAVKIKVETRFSMD